MRRAVLVTGAYGYLGSIIRARMDAAGWDTVALVRTPSPGDRAIKWTLGQLPSKEALASADALVHCAYDFHPRTRADVWRVNVEGSAELLRASKEEGIQRILVLSSMSAYLGTKQIYGRAKLAIEGAAVEAGGIAVRPGLVYGPQPRGMAASLLKLTRLPLVPDFGSGARQYPVHEDDLAAAIERILDAPQWNSEVFGIAQPQAVSFRALLLAIARINGNHCRFIRTPWRGLYALLRIAEFLRASPVRADSLLGLVRPAPGVLPSNGFPDLLENLRVLVPEGAPT